MQNCRKSANYATVNYEKLIAEKDARIASLEGQASELQELVKVLLARIVDLEARLKRNSGNSDKPPSSEGLSKKPAIPRPKGGKRGGRPGHTGKTLEMVDSEKVHDWVIHQAEGACSCGCMLADVAGELLEERRQVFDLPPSTLLVSEHRIESKICPACGLVHKGVFPADVSAPVQYGHRVRALAGMLNVEHSMPVERIKRLFGDLYGYALNENTIHTAVERLHACTEKDEQIIRQAIEQALVAHFDESGARVEGSLHWVHTASTQDWTYFFVHKNRGRQALESEQSVLPNFKGRAIHDFWKSYFHFDVEHGTCAAHLLRELTALVENQHRKWAGRMHDLLYYLYHFSDKGRATVEAKKLKFCDRQYERLIRAADEEEPPPDTSNGRKPKKTKGRNLLERLDRYRDEVMAFARYDYVPFTNNTAERDIRPWKTKLKVSTCFRTLKGANRFARIKGFCSTTKKQGHNIFEQLCNVLNGHSFLRPVGVT